MNFRAGRGEGAAGGMRNRIVNTIVAAGKWEGSLRCKEGSLSRFSCSSNPTYQNNGRSLPRGMRPGGQPEHFQSGTEACGFNTAAFANRVLGFTPGVGPYRVGNSGAGTTIVGPGITELDFSLAKSFRDYGSARICSFRSEFFNLPNHPIFANPGATVGNPHVRRDQCDEPAVTADSVWAAAVVLSWFRADFQEAGENRLPHLGVRSIVGWGRRFRPARAFSIESRVTVLARRRHIG